MVHGPIVLAQNFEMDVVAVDDTLVRVVSSQLCIAHSFAGAEGDHIETVMDVYHVCNTAAAVAGSIKVACRVVVADQEVAVGAVLGDGDGGDGSVAKIAGGRLLSSFLVANVVPRAECCFEVLGVATAVYQDDQAEGLRRRMGATLDG